MKSTALSRFFAAIVDANAVPGSELEIHYDVGLEEKTRVEAAMLADESKIEGDDNDSALVRGTYWSN